MMARLDSICKLNMGQSPDSASYNKEGRGIPFFQGNADFGDLYPSVRVWCDAPTKIAYDGDILISVRAPIGALNIADRECCIGRGLAALTVNESICNKKYLWYCISSKVDELNAKGTGSTFKAISKNVLAETEIVLPDMEQQIKIANELELVFNLISLRKQQLEKLDELVKSRFVEMFGDFIKGSAPVEFESVCDFVTVGIANSATHAFCDNGVIMFRNQNIKEDCLDTSDIVYITSDFASKYKSKMLKQDDLLIVRTGYPGVACLVPEQYEGCQTFTTLIARLKRVDTIKPRFVCHYINSEYGKKYVRDNSAGAAQQNFGATALSKLPIYIPPVKLQDEYINFVEQTDKSKFEIQKSLNQLETLKKALMQKYFG